MASSVDGGVTTARHREMNSKLVRELRPCLTLLGTPVVPSQVGCELTLLLCPA